MTATEFNDLIEEKFEDGLFGFAEQEDTEEGQSHSDFLIENNLEFVENNDVEAYDSYGSEDSILERVFLHKPSGNYFMVYGTRQSYSGTEWDGIKEVNKTEKTITVWT